LLATKVKEKLSDESLEDYNFLNQCKLSLNEKIECLRKLDESVSELISTSDSETADVELQKEIEESDERRAELQKIVFDIDDRLNLMLQSSQAAASQTNTMSGNSEQTKAKHVVRAKLPKLQAKTFDVQEWQEFWESFESAIHQNECLSEVDKFIYLRNLLLGPAKSSIAGFALTATNYKEALELLRNRYGKKNVIQRALIQELLKLKHVYNNSDLDGLRKLYDACALEAQGVNVSTYSSIVVPTIMEKLPEKFRLTITREREFLVWSMKELLEAMTKEIELREAHHAVITTSEGQERKCEGGKPYTKKGPFGNSSAAALLARQQQDSAKFIPRCAYCLQEHDPNNCTKVKGIIERKQLIRKYGRCFFCLKRDI
jgi:phytoene/squalene synthetase